MGKDKMYVELAKAKIKEQRNIVISECSKGGFTIAQQLEVKEGNRVTSVFMKGALHVDSIEGLHNMRDTLNVAISKHEEMEEDSGFDNDDWEDVPQEEVKELTDGEWDE